MWIPRDESLQQAFARQYAAVVVNLKRANARRQIKDSLLWIL